MKELHLFTKDNGAVVTTEAGAIITVSLEGNPTTGYEWALDNADPTIIGNIQSTFRKSDSKATGSGGAYIFTSNAIKKGSSKFSFKYWRRWEGNSSIIKRFEIQVNVL